MTSQNTSDLDINKLIWISIGIFLAGLSHWQRLSIWIPIFHSGLIFFRLYIPYKFPNFWDNKYKLINLIRLFMMIAGVTGVYLTYGTLTGRDVGIALLVILAGLKIFECKTKRDLYVSTYLGYFLVITNFFYTQTIPTALYMFLVIIIITTGLINFNDTEKKLTLLGRLKFSAIIVLQSVPLLLVLFILFPRVQGPLWGLPQDAYTGITGIDDQMTPGTISKLVQSREVAFRVTFEDDIPNRSKLYWRGPVLWQTDGRKWTTGKIKTGNFPAPLKAFDNITHYEITLEPTNKKWMFGLETIADNELPDKTYLTTDRQLKSFDPIRSRKAYKLSSFTEYYQSRYNDEEIERGLALPKNRHIQTKQFAQELKDQYIEPEKIIAAALNWFKDEDFTYTLTPPLINGDSVDQLLFDTRQGFCEHYAAAFTVLMRSADIPARIVTGYQGGEVNPLGNYLIVRQYHAHAWTEVWLEDQGWIRVDPTSVVSPNRVSEGIESAIPDAAINIPLNLDENKFVLGLWRRLGNSIDMINYQWAQWVLGYGPEKQKYFLNKIGLGLLDWKKMTLILITTIGLIVIAIGLYVFNKSIKETDQAKRYYNKFCKKLSKIGLYKLNSEGPVDFASRISRARKDLENDVNYITELYISIRYGSEEDKFLQLKNSVQSFTTK